jgi:hypothetical protein
VKPTYRPLEENEEPLSPRFLVKLFIAGLFVAGILDLTAAGLQHQGLPTQPARPSLGACPLPMVDEVLVITLHHAEGNIEPTCTLAAARGTRKRGGF